MKIVNKKYVLAGLLLAAVAVPKGVEAFSSTFGDLTTTLKSVLGSCSVCMLKCPWKSVCERFPYFKNHDDYVAAQKDLNNPKFKSFNEAAAQTCGECTDKKCDSCSLNAFYYALISRCVGLPEQWLKWREPFGPIVKSVQKPTLFNGAPKFEPMRSALKRVCDSCIGNFENCTGCTQTIERCTTCPQTVACDRCGFALVNYALAKYFKSKSKE